MNALQNCSCTPGCVSSNSKTCGVRQRNAPRFDKKTFLDAKDQAWAPNFARTTRSNCRAGDAKTARAFLAVGRRSVQTERRWRVESQLELVVLWSQRSTLPRAAWSPAGRKPTPLHSALPREALRFRVRCVRCVRARSTLLLDVRVRAESSSRRCRTNRRMRSRNDNRSSRGDNHSCSNNCTTDSGTPECETFRVGLCWA